jgi:preprotein translocase subunit YajC
MNSAFAQGTAGGPPGGEYFQFVLIGGMFVVLYFLMIRPQQKKAKEHQNLLKNLQKGDEVIASGGILAKIAKVDEAYVSLEIATNVEIKVQKGSIQAVLPKGSIRKAD